MRSLIFILLISFASTGMAEIITFKNYRLNTDTNIIEDEYGLQWLRWSVTGNNKDLYQTYLDFTEKGWALANNAQVSRLFNDFDFGVKFDANPSTSQSVIYNDGEAENSGSALHTFFNIFGSHVDSASYSDWGYGYEIKGARESIVAVFGDNYSDRYEYLNTASLSDDYYYKVSYLENGDVWEDEGYRNGHVSLHANEGADLFGYGTWSFAFVKGSEVVDVSEPTPFIIFLTSILLALRSRKFK